MEGDIIGQVCEFFKPTDCGLISEHTPCLPELYCHFTQKHAQGSIKKYDTGKIAIIPESLTPCGIITSPYQ